MLEAAARNGWLDRERARAQRALLAIKRAGADLIITYYAELLAKLIESSNGPASDNSGNLGNPDRPIPAASDVPRPRAANRARHLLYSELRTDPIPKGAQ